MIGFRSVTLQLHGNRKNTHLLTDESIYWINIDDKYKKSIKNCSTCLEFQQMQSKEKRVACVIPGKSWEKLGTNIFTLNKKNYVCIDNYHRSFPIGKRTKDLSADHLIKSCKIALAEYGLTRKIMSDTRASFI